MSEELIELLGRSAEGLEGDIWTNVVMNIDDAFGACRQATLHQLVVYPEVRRVEYATSNIICKILPRYSKTKYVEVVLRGKMLHL
jgi:hypothetical protein